MSCLLYASSSAFGIVSFTCSLSSRYVGLPICGFKLYFFSLATVFMPRNVQATSSIKLLAYEWVSLVRSWARFRFCCCYSYLLYTHMPKGTDTLLQLRFASLCLCGAWSTGNLFSVFLSLTILSPIQLLVGPACLYNRRVSLHTAAVSQW